MPDLFPAEEPYMQPMSCVSAWSAVAEASSAPKSSKDFRISVQIVNTAKLTKNPDWMKLFIKLFHYSVKSAYICTKFNPHVAYLHP